MRKIVKHSPWRMNELWNIVSARIVRTSQKLSGVVSGVGTWRMRVGVRVGKGGRLHEVQFVHEAECCVAVEESFV